MTTDSRSFSVGQEVILLVTENPRLNRQPARIVELCQWGAHVVCRAAATGRFRAVFTEMAPVGGNIHQHTTAMVESGYTGDVCQACGGLRMRRNGACLVCDDCGNNSGCG